MKLFWIMQFTEIFHFQGFVMIDFKNKALVNNVLAGVLIQKQGNFEFSGIGWHYVFIEFFATGFSHTLGQLHRNGIGSRSRRLENHQHIVLIDYRSH